MGDPDSVPGLERSLGEENSNPLQYSCLENFMDRGAWQATVSGAAKSQTQLSDSHFTSLGLSVQTESWQRLTEFCQENTLITTNTLYQQSKRQLYTWTSQVINNELRLCSLQPKMKKLCIVKKNKTGS